VVNTTSRIESYTIGGQILISDSTRVACQDLLRIDGKMEVMPKGLTEPITIYDVGGLLGEKPVALIERGDDDPVRLETPLDVQLAPLSGTHLGEAFAGQVIGLGRRKMEITAAQACSNFSNLKITFVDAAEQNLPENIYAKVIRQLDTDQPGFLAHATSLPPDAEQLFTALREASCGGDTAVVRLLHLTDFHIFSDPHGLIKGICSNDSLCAVLAHAQQHYPESDAVILGGDLAQDEAEDTYQRLAAMLASWTTSPFMVTPGNHANLPALQRALIPALKEVSAYSDCLELSAWQVIALNSHEQGSVAGQLADAELARLESVLSNSADKHILVAIHHPPVPVGSRWMDAIGLKNWDSFWAVIDRFPQVRGVICGHIHQQFDAMRGSVRILGTPSTCVQFVPGQDVFCLDDKSPGYRWLELMPDGSIRTGVERIEGFIPPDLNNNEPY
jgi:Icc protein